jgi:hypothetical protein
MKLIPIAVLSENCDLLTQGFEIHQLRIVAIIIGWVVRTLPRATLYP